MLSNKSQANSNLILKNSTFHILIKQSQENSPISPEKRNIGGVLILFSPVIP